MEVKIKRLSKEAVIPKYAKSGDAGMDLVATSRIFDNDGNVSYGTGLAFEIPDGYVGLLFPRSSNSKKDIILTNSVGVLDSGYRGEVFFKFKPSIFFASDLTDPGYDSDGFDFVVTPYAKDQGVADFGLHIYEVGDRIGQIIILPYPNIEFVEVEDLSETERGDGGFGSSGK